MEERLRREIASGVYQPNQRLPSMHDLARKHQTTFKSVHRALNRLQASGHVVIFMGKGTYVTGDKSSSSVRRARLGPRLAEMLLPDDIRQLRSCLPDVKIETDTEQVPPQDLDAEVVDAENLLNRYRTGQVAAVESLGVAAGEIAELGVAPDIIQECILDGVFCGVPIGAMPLLLGICRPVFESRPDVPPPQEGWTLREFKETALRLTRRGPEQSSRTFGFNFANQTLDVHALTRSAGADWRTASGFLRDENMAAIRDLWTMLQQERCAFPVLPGNRPSWKRLYGTGRIAMFFIEYKDAFDLLTDPPFLRRAGVEFRSWGGEPARLQVLTAGSRTRYPEFCRVVMRHLLSARFQARMLRRGKWFPVTLDDRVRRSLRRRVRAPEADLLLKVARTAYSPWRVDGRPDAFWRAEQNTQDYLNDIRSLAEITEDAKRDEPWTPAIPRRFW